jgi:hypothetical protein
MIESWIPGFKEREKPLGEGENAFNVRADSQLKR